MNLGLVSLLCLLAAIIVGFLRNANVGMSAFSAHVLPLHWGLPAVLWAQSQAAV